MMVEPSQTATSLSVPGIRVISLIVFSWGVGVILVQGLWASEKKVALRMHIRTLNAWIIFIIQIFINITYTIYDERYKNLNGLSKLPQIIFRVILSHPF